MGNRITIKFNYFGPFIKKEDLEKVLDPEFNSLIGTVYEINRIILEEFFELPVSVLKKETIERYEETTSTDLHFYIVPHSDKIEEKLLKPLQSAKRNYCLGDYISTIAVCGIFAEMLAILVWKMNELNVSGRRLLEKEEEKLFGRSFENLGQDQRINILSVLNLIDAGQKEKFDQIRRVRRQYLHFWSSAIKDQRRHSLEVLKHSFHLLREITDIGLADAGTVKVNPKLVKMIEYKENDNPS